MWLWTKNWHSTTTLRNCARCNYHLRALWHICLLVDQDTTNTIVCLLVCTRLDYCNAIFYGVTKHNIGHLQCVQNSLAHVVYLATYRSSASRVCRHLQWLSVQERITFKIAMLTRKVLTHHPPGYLCELIVKHPSVYNLRLADNNRLVIPRTKTKIASRAFRVSAPITWKSSTFTSVANSRLTCLTASTVDHRLSKDRRRLWLAVRSGIRLSKGLCIMAPPL